jgi:alkaline phosphatase D
VYGDCTADGCPELPVAWRDLFHNRRFGKARGLLPMIGVLDDHDYGQNDCGATNPFKQYAKEIFLERFGVPAHDPRRSREGLYTSHSFGPVGQRTQVLVLDTRWFRSELIPSGCDVWGGENCTGKERYVPYSDDESERHTILGEAQWAWLHDRLEEPADVRIIVSSIQVLARRHGWECWALIPSEVTRLMRLIGTTRAKGVVLLSGDRHSGGVYRLRRGHNSAPYDIVEVTSSALTHAQRREDDEPDEAGPLRQGPLVRENNFGTVRLDWAARALTLELRASDDCGLSEQPWAKVCKAHDGTAGATLRSVTLSLDLLAP